MDQRMSRALAQTLAGRLQCQACGTMRRCTPADAARYLREGWPTCCGTTMTLLTDAPLDPRQHNEPMKPVHPHQHRPDA